jgi:sugar lactone lactonase YvrE
MRPRTLPLSLVALSALTGGAAAAPVQTLVLFDPAAGETPEAIAIDGDGTKYISLALTGEVRKIAPDGVMSTHAYLPLAHGREPCDSAFGMPIMGALALDFASNVYVNIVSCDAGMTGVWKVAPGGHVSQVANLPGDSLPNGIAYRDGWLFVADSNLGVIWRVPADGAAPAAVWAQGGPLEPLPDFFPGPNGLQLFRDEVYVAVSDRMHVVAYRIQPDGSAGAPRIHAAGVGLDDFAFDIRGNLYGTTDPFNTVVLVRPDGTSEILLTAADGLDGPTAAAFGRGAADQKTLYITNAAFPFFTTTFRPSLMALELDVPGKPRP